MLLRGNERANLTAAAEAGPAWTRHILDSLTLIPVLSELSEGARVIDVGSGGGLPGIPLAICVPGLRFTLLEATGKKVEFMRQAAAALGLSHVEVVQARAEAAGHDRGERTGTGRVGGHRERYDAVLARAVGPLNVLAELTIPFARPPAGETPGGVIALIKGQKADEELAAAARALKVLRAEHEATMDTPTGRVVVLTKVGPTPRDYPRRDGEPARAPLE
jgi:16S rRNA (guanine527-N7)-methyltransferase